MANGRRIARRTTAVALVALVLAVGVVPACADRSRIGHSASPSYAIETADSGIARDLDALRSGQFRFEQRLDVLCSVLDNTTRVVWPQGFRTTDGRSLHDQTGKVIVASGDIVTLRGGEFDDHSTSVCTEGSPDTWFAADVVMRQPS